MHSPLRHATRQLLSEANARAARLFNHRQGRSIPDDAGVKLVEWLEMYLR